MNLHLLKTGMASIVVGGLILSVTPLQATDLETPSENGAIERSTIDAPERTIQMPVFQNGRFSGYSEEPLDPDRKPASFSSRPTLEAPAGAAAPEEIPQTEAPPSPPQ